VSLKQCGLESRSWRDALHTTLCDKVYQCLAAGRFFSPGTPASSTNRTDNYDITEILLKVVVLNTISMPFICGVGCHSFPVFQ
jgi:hypothetical protein